MTMEVNLQTCARLLQACNTHHSINQGKQLHALLIKTGLTSILTYGNRLLQMYTRCGNIGNAWRVFEEMPQTNCFSWNTLIEGYMKSGEKERSLELFHLMPFKNDYSWNVVVIGFSKAGELDVARGLFDDMPRKNAVVWNAMIHAYARKGCAKDAINLFRNMSLNQLEESGNDSFVLATVLGACTDLVAFDCGKQIHAQIVLSKIEVDPVLGSSLINFYGKCGDVDSADGVLKHMKELNDFSLSALISAYANCGRLTDARRLFNQKHNPCVVLWNSMIAGYVSNNKGIEALLLFNDLRRNGIFGDFSTFSSVLSACSSLGIHFYGKQIHAHSYKVGMTNDVIIASALVDMYYKCGSSGDACYLFDELAVYDTILLNSMITIYSSCGRIEDAKYIFSTMPCKNLISWNSMMVGLSQNGYPLEALGLFYRMNSIDLRMDTITLASVISSCASISLLELGEQVLARAIITGLKSDKIISTSFVDFYCKCGLVEEGRKIFDEMIKSDEISWNSMLMGYATNGYGTEALTLFDEMRFSGVRPTEITFIGVLSACDHSGLVEEGRKWFHAMKYDYHIDPGIEHYSCMVDLFSRAGCLEEAVYLIEDMPFKADASMWSSVLRGCVAHGNKNLGKTVADRIIELDPENSGAYVQLSNIFASSGNWDTSALIRDLMRRKHVKKNAGFSWADC